MGNDIWIAWWDDFRYMTMHDVYATSIVHHSSCLHLPLPYVIKQRTGLNVCDQTQSFT